MALNESCVPLLSDDQLHIWDLGDIDCRKTTNWTTSSDTGSSSGYDSSLDDTASEFEDDLSDSVFSDDDSESRNEESSDDEIDSDIDDDYESDLDEKQEVMTYSNTHALCKQMKYILSVPDLCDVTFEVGPNKVPVHGLKAIMGTRSRMLYSLILKAEKELEEFSSKKSKFSKKKKNKSSRLVIPVTKYEPEDFRKIIQFVHCGTVEVDTESLTGILCGAVQFELEDLEAACWDFLSRGVNLKSTDQLLKSAEKYKQHKTATKLILKFHEYLTTKCKSTKKRETTV